MGQVVEILSPWKTRTCLSYKVNNTSSCWCHGNVKTQGISSQGIDLFLMEYSGLGIMRVNSLWPTDDIWWHKSESTLAQVMLWCHMAPRHYLNQSWLLISELRFCGIHLRTISPLLLSVMRSKIILLKLLLHLPGPNELTMELQPEAVTFPVH